MEGKLFLGQYLIWVTLLLVQLQGCKSCIEKERKALLELKKYVMSKSQTPDYVLPTWDNDTKSDCCRWKGIMCNHTSRRVIGLSLGVFFNLNENLILDLSLLHPFEEVRSLDLSSGFKGFVDNVEGYKSLRKFRNLEILNLSYNSLNSSIIPFLNAATSLKTLSLQSSFMLSEIKDLTNLNLLDLAGNRLNGSMLGLTHLKRLKALDLSYNVVCEMKNLQELDVSGNRFVGHIPLCLCSLNKLQVLDFSSNQLSGNLPSNFNNLEGLEYLSLLDNNFTGLFSLDPLANLTKLKVFKLSSTSDMVQVETKSIWQPKFQLTVAVLGDCSLEEIPSFLLYQKNLRLVDLSNNRLSGEIPTWLLVNNSKLEVLQLQNNAFTIFQMPTIVHNLQFLDFSANDINGLFPDNIGHALPNLVRMNGSNNGFQGNFPSSMGEMVNITFLDLSYNNFSGKLPRSFVTGCFSLENLKLSHNKFSGRFLSRGTSFTSLEELRMDSNLFTGKIGVGLFSSHTSLSLLDMSNNFLTGGIPSWISKFSSLDTLSMSNNFLEGAIPPFLLLMPFLSFIDVSENLFSGALPSHVSGSYRQLFLQNNNFKGTIPKTLLENVQVLDLWNKLTGSIPQFVNTSDIYILLLRGNNLIGSIPRQLCDLKQISLLDLSDNKLNGSIPSCLYNLSFGPDGVENSGMGVGRSGDIALEFYRSTFVVESLYLEFSYFHEVEIRFATKKAELGDLLRLRVMNLSRNFLSSSIPSSFSNLKNIESLDLSHNMLQGSIPHQLTSLTALAILDVSYNNLSGIIPQGKQFNTFDKTTYLGNPLLCGSPRDKSCEAKKSSEESNNGGEEDDEAPLDMVAFYFSTASTYVAALTSILVLMCFDCPWRRAWLRIVDASIASAKSMFP
ncbi:hypothetical protein EUTSA_v10000563mg [Eutrema salsugineum]|uniref:Leucine-rich repeat-containing N-terminal plant-type domain-containing protein n=1 Tax=Eutrema salsugineum TaxID=72664 RepID=V4LVD8_EUTSA|nr:hypothetical protein EUTSA_v10000563mg [Eutrema salsugineum]